MSASIIRRFEEAVCAPTVSELIEVLGRMHPDSVVTSIEQQEPRRMLQIHPDVFIRAELVEKAEES